MIKYISFIFLSLISPTIEQNETPVFESISQCCSLGSYRAKAQLDEACDDIKVPVKDIIPEMQATCISTMELCCTKTRRELQCEEGRRAAMSGQVSVVTVEK